ncbi:MORN repeat-containing protein 3 isoform X3 [Balearica regulorum gibbericeps]|uniref:MORN repeat-containing protein 3 isoform X3 n=1 Tax=Balearica regulorum gibbericeps TaxID=100784 RepID=UPI003F628218
MPIVKHPRATEPLWHEWDRKAQKCGLRHTAYAVNGDQYTGEWLDNLKHGKGTQVWKCTGAIYSGDWKFGKRDGYGSYSIPDPVTKEYKKVYTGWWKNDKKCGYGVTFYPDGERYEGEWSSGLRSGWGRMYYQDGSIYEGQWLEDRPSGQGMLRLLISRLVISSAKQLGGTSTTFTAHHMHDCALSADCKVTLDQWLIQMKSALASRGNSFH